MYEIESAKEAVEITLKLWQYLARYPQKDKYDWPGWKKYEEMRFACPLCEFIEQQTGYTVCSDCPLYHSGWVTGIDAGCCHPKSPYDKWADAFIIDDTEAKHKYAKQIVNKLKRWLQEHS